MKTKPKSLEMLLNPEQPSKPTTTTGRHKLPTGKRTRKRESGKKKVRSCLACRDAHVKCVAQCYGIPCERCAKKYPHKCSLILFNGKAVSSPSSSELHFQTQKIGLDSTEGQKLRQIAAAAQKQLETKDRKEGSTSRFRGKHYLVDDN